MASIETVTSILKELTRTRLGMGKMIDDFTATVGAWHHVLEPIPDEIAFRATVLLARSEDAFIHPGQVFQAALDLLDKEDSAEDAWKVVRSKAGGCSVPLRGRTALAAQVLPSPEDRDAWSVDALPHLRRAFEAEYKRLAQEWRRAAAMGEGRLLTDGKE